METIRWFVVGGQRGLVHDQNTETDGEPSETPDGGYPSPERSWSDMDERETAALVFAVIGAAMVVFPGLFRSLKEAESELFSGLRPIPGHPMRSLIAYRFFGLFPLGIAAFLYFNGGS